ncbi:MAG: NAD-dependent epimerase/dehydratase family protein [Candidatus Ratteibacteria bacterium]|jgi:nucleoside-diphosphate-sugar epimerase
MRKKVLIIGGTRFLGREIAELFLAHGYEVSTMTRGVLSASKGSIERILCDKNKREEFRKALLAKEWDVIIDTILNAEDLQFVVETVGNNIGHFIHTGSVGVYGDAVRIPAEETIPRGEYSGEDILFHHKLQQDQVLMHAFHTQNFPATSLRMSNIYGAGDIPLDGWGGRAKEFFKMVYEEKEIWMAEDGRALLHPGHVKDLARSFLCAAENSISLGEIYNIAGSYALMLKDYVALIAEAMGKKPSYFFTSQEEVLSRYAGYTSARGLKFVSQHMCASIAKAGRDLSWRPVISLELGMRDNIEWMQKEKMI